MIGRSLVYFTYFHSYLLVKTLKFKLSHLSQNPTHEHELKELISPAPAHGVDTGNSLYYPKLDGGWYKLLSLVVVFLTAEKYAPSIKGLPIEVKCTVSISLLVRS